MPRRPPNAAPPQSSWSVPSRPTPRRRHGSSAVVAMAAEVTSKVRDSASPCGRLKPSPGVRRRRWPDAGSRLDPPAFERAQALTLADRGSANFGEGLRHMREALTFAQPAPLPIPPLRTAFALCQKENEFACRRPLTRRRGPCGGSQPPWVGVRDPVARDAA
eukprot:scaffold52513_cov43-Phaeocystis_antarctica.AAC.1